jgi:hypothetical protein
VLSATFWPVGVDHADRGHDRQIRRQRGTIAAGSPMIRRVAVVVAMTALVLVSGWALKDAYAAYLGERWWAGALAMDSYIQKSREQADDQDYVDLLTAADGAFHSDPTNVNYGYWLNVYRWQSLSRVVDPNSRQVVLHPDVVPFVARIADDLDQVRGLCPTFGPPYALEGQLRLFVLKEQRGAELIRTGLRLAAYDPATCLVAGELAAREAF